MGSLAIQTEDRLIPISQNSATISRYGFCEPVLKDKEEKCQDLFGLKFGKQ
jgi:hypothetical protein